MMSRAAEAAAEPLGGRAVGRGHRPGHVAAGGEHPAQGLGPAQRGLARAGMPDQHAKQLPGRQVRGQVQLGPGRDLVPEQHGLLVRVAGAADRAQQRHVVDVAAGRLVQARALGQPGGEQAGAQAVLERHAGGQVRGQGERGDQFGQLDRPAVGRAQACTPGLRPAHGRACSSCAASRSSVASPPNRPRKCTPTGRPSSFHHSGTDIAGCPVMLAITPE